MIPRQLPLALLLCLPLAGCVVHLDGSDNWVPPEHQGSGVAKSEPRTVPGFRRIEVQGATDIVAAIGPATEVTVTADDNLLQFVRTEVRGDTLVIDMQDGSYSFDVDLVVHVVTPALEGVKIEGSSDVEIRGLQGQALAIEIQGSGDVRASGSVERLSVSIAGSGDMNLFELQARQAKIDISGSGDVEVYASERLDARVSGSGDVRYRGAPRECQAHVDGSGSVASG
jgi:hypothetical protein